jgi:hypothetical protein
MGFENYAEKNPDPSPQQKAGEKCGLGPAEAASQSHRPFEQHDSGIVATRFENRKID